MRYIDPMSETSKTDAPPAFTLRDERTGRCVTVKGFGALGNEGLSLRSDIDLTKPIAEQVSRKSSTAPKRSRLG